MCGQRTAGAAVGRSRARPRNQDTFFTFSQNVELPNKTLPAGRYLFQLADSASNRHIVKVMSADRKEIYATLLAIPFYSNDRPADDPQVRFMETPASGTNGTSAAGTNAIKIWFYPGTTVGHEFIYPRSQAMRIASRTGSSVLTTKSETEIAASVADADLTRVDRAGTDTAVSTEASATPSTAASAEAPEPAPAPRATATRPPRRRRPRSRTPERAPTPDRDRRGPHRSAEHGQLLAVARSDWHRFAGGQPLAAPLAPVVRGIGSQRSRGAWPRR